MWPVSRAPGAVALLGITSLFACGNAAFAQSQANGYPYPYPSSYYNNQSVQYGLNLPQVPVSNGSDEIRAADGTSCKSSISGNGPYLDVGMLGNQDFYGAFASGTVYGRVVMQLGEQPKRIDCTSLYHLEIERLQHELRLVRMGAGASNLAVPEAKRAAGNWQTEGWGKPGAPAKVGKSNLGMAAVATAVAATTEKPSTIKASSPVQRPAKATAAVESAVAVAPVMAPVAQGLPAPAVPALALPPTLELPMPTEPRRVWIELDPDWRTTVFDGR